MVKLCNQKIDLLVDEAVFKEVKKWIKQVLKCKLGFNARKKFFQENRFERKNTRFWKKAISS
jgi:hypothetical protein